MKVLLYDIETAMSRGYFFDLYKEGNIIFTDQEWYMLSFAYKWLDEKTTHFRGLPDYSLYKKSKVDDSALVKELWSLFDEADIIIGHNGDKFDIRKTNARFIRHGLDVPSPYKTIDTLKVARRYFKFDSNRLDALGEYLGLGRKERTGGIELWKDCMAGDMKAWQRMKRYNKQDVVLLENVYLKLRPWMKTHPNMNVVEDESEPRCPICLSDSIQRRGWEVTNSGLSKYRRYKCNNEGCGAWCRGRTTRTDVEVRP